MTTNDLASLKGECKKYECTIIADKWIDRRTRSLMNFIIHCPKGTMFLKSIDAFTESHTLKLLLKEICKVIEYVGVENVVQVKFKS